MVRDRRGSLWLGTGCLAYAALVACAGSPFTAQPDDDASGSDAGGNASGNSPTAGKASATAGTHAGSSLGGAAGSHAGGSAGNAGRGGVASAGNAGKPTMSDGGEVNGGSGPVIPAVPTDSLVYWFKADAGVKQDAPVSIWEDQSGNAFHATQSQGDLQPTLVTATGVPYPILQFDGSDDLLELPPIELAVDKGLSFFAVAGRGAATTCSAIMELSNGAEVDDIHAGSLDDTFHYEVYNKSIPAQPNAFPVGQLRLVEVVHLADADKSLAELRVNGTLSSSAVIPPPVKVLRATNFIGQTLYADCSPYSGGIAEIIFYSRKLSAAERIGVEQYLMNKWQCCK